MSSTDTTTDEQTLRHLTDWLDHAKEKMHVAVVFSGSKDDPQRVLRKSVSTRSWKSYEDVATDIADTLRQSGFRKVSLFPEGVDLLSELVKHRVDMVWINSGGVQGIDPVSHLPALLEMAGLPYVGHNPVNASILDNKNLLKWGLVAKHIPTAPFLIWSHMRERFPGRDHPKFQRNFGEYTGPFVVKPVSGRGSVMVEVVEHSDDLPDCIEKVARETHNPVLVEKYLSGDEYTVAVTGQIVHRHGRLEQLPQPLAFSEIRRRLDRDERIFTSMDVKPITADRMVLLDQDKEAAEIEQLDALAQRIFSEFNLETLVRVDIRADETGQMHVMEANPKPDLKRPTPDRTSLVVSGLSKIGMDYQDLLLSLFSQSLYDAYKRGKPLEGI